MILRSVSSHKLLLELTMDQPDQRPAVPTPQHPQEKVTQAGAGKAAAEKAGDPRMHHEKPGC